MKKIIYNDELKLNINGKYTFAGAVNEIFDQIAKDHYWKAPDTLKNNITAYNNIIAPNLENHNYKSIDMYIMEDIERAVQYIVEKGIREKNKVYADSYIAHLRDLYVYAFSAAAEKGWCPGFTWADIEEVGEQNEKEIPKKRSLRLRKSFSYYQEAVIFVELLENSPAEMSGKLWGLLLMYAFGLRNNESVAVRFRDIITEEKSVPYILIYKSTTGYNSTEEESSGKTENADREIPVPSMLIKAIEERKERIRAYILSNPDRIAKRFPEFDSSHLEEFIGALHIACDEMDFFRPISSRKLSDAGRDFFRELGCFDKVEFADADYFVHSDEYDEEEYGIFRDPTAYLFRRNFGTHLLHCGLSAAERFYVMGHKIEEGLYARNEYITDNRFRILYFKMSRRPLLNGIDKNRFVVVDINHPLFRRSMLPNEQIRVVVKNGETVRLDIENNEPDDMTSINVYSPQSGNKMLMDYIIMPLPSHRDVDIETASGNSYPTEFDNLHDYHEEYLKAYKDYKKKRLSEC